MRTKLAADLKRGDGVLIAPGDYRVVEAVEWPGTYVAPGTQGVRVRWFGRDHASLLAADREMTIAGDDQTATEN